MSPPNHILGIDTSCDDTACGLVTTEGVILSNIVASQVEEHAPFGGVVPEIAARSHLEALPWVVERALSPLGGEWDEVDAVAVTYGPGLVGSLLAGISYAKGLSLASGKPLIGINHLEAHVFSALISEECPPQPLVALVVSGGHTILALVEDDGGFELLGGTRDDACGEAFDKVAKLLGLGYPGGPAIEKIADQTGEPAKKGECVEFPRPMKDRGELDFSFSGLKTAVVNYVRGLSPPERERGLTAIVRGFQEAAVDVLMIKLRQALLRTKTLGFIVVGGVAANRRLRELAQALAEEMKISHYIPPPELCTDNGAMVAAAAGEKMKKGEFASLDLAAYPNLELGQKPSPALFSR